MPCLSVAYHERERERAMWSRGGVCPTSHAPSTARRPTADFFFGRVVSTLAFAAADQAVAAHRHTIIIAFLATPCVQVILRGAKNKTLVFVPLSTNRTIKLIQADFRKLRSTFNQGA